MRVRVLMQSPDAEPWGGYGGRFLAASDSSLSFGRLRAILPPLDGFTPMEVTLMDTAFSLLYYGLPLVILGFGTAALFAHLAQAQTLVPVPVRARRRRG